MSGEVVQKMPTDEGYRVTIRDDGGFTCDLATPSCWFPEHELNDYATGWHQFLSRDGDTIKLTADNGTWIWRLTGRKYIHDYGRGTAPLVLCEGRWPD